MGREEDLLTDIERLLKQKFVKEEASRKRLPSTAAESRRSDRLEQLTLPKEKRPRMPLTKDKYVVKENEELVAWERLTREFLRELTPRHGHRVSAPMVYEWATGISVKLAMEARSDEGSPLTKVRADLRKINQILRYYFGKPYMTYIAGRKVPNCYRIKAGYYIKRHRPQTLTLWVEYSEGVLDP